MGLISIRMRRQVVALVVALAGWAAASPRALGVPTVDAGPDATISFEQTHILQGAAQLSPLEFWTADGNGDNEDKLIKYNELTGVTAIGPLLSTEMPPRYFGYPSDLQKIGTQVYGVDTNRRQIYLLNDLSGAVTPIGLASGYSMVMSLAHDPVGDRLWGVDIATDRILRINRTTGVMTSVGSTGPTFVNTRGLAFDEATGLIFAIDKSPITQQSTLYTMNPSNGVKNVVMTLPTNATTLYDELDFFRDELYAILSFGPFMSCQLQHINLDTGEITDVGPVIPNVSAHSLIVRSMPEDLAWSVVSGPGVVTFDDTQLVDSEVTFSALGTYVLALTAFADAGPVVDTVTIEVAANACLIDTDGDGTVDCLDGCPADPAKTVPGQCGCGIADADTDSDGTADCVDGCPADPSKIAPGACGCGMADTDFDGDGTADCVDGCPNDPGKTVAGVCGCGLADTDTDADGTADCLDGCPADPLKLNPGLCGCGVIDVDTDGDGVVDCADGCPSDPAKTVPGLCGCGTADTDSDGDMTPDCQDGCPNDPNLIEAGVCGCGVVEFDTDGDGTPDCVDGCPNDAAKTAPGICGCGVIDVDSDGDGVADCHDACPDDPNKTVADMCGCGAPPSCDDGNVCTQDACDPLLGCVNTDMSSGCDDDNACTQDSCDPQVGCENTDISASCDDGLFCNGAESCDIAVGCVVGSDPCGQFFCDEMTDSCDFAQPKLWMVFGGAPSVPTVGVVEQADIVSYEPIGGVWSLEFDGSDVGLASQRVDGFARLATGELLLSFDVPLNIPGLIGGPGGATLVDDSDIVMFTPTTLGANTTGTFTFYFDGSDVGLAADNEDVDSIAIAPDGRLILSTLAAVIAPGVNGAAHDLFVFNATSLGGVTAGTFEMYVKGSSVGLSVSTENIVGSTVLANGDLLLTTSGAFAVTGLTGTNKDVMRFVPTVLGLATQGTFSMFLQTVPLGIPTTARVAEIEWVP